MEQRMRRLLLVLAVLGLVLAGTAGTALAANGKRACNFVVAGKDATADGSVLMGYNNDWSANNFSYLEVVPATDPEQHQFVQILTKGDWPEGGINEHQLSACYGVATDIAPAVEAADPYLNDGWGAEMWADILRNCSSADQAIDYFEQQANARGFTGDAAGSFAFADPEKAWVVEVFGGHHWVAARVPDDAVFEQPNMLRIRSVDLSKRNKFRGSADLEQFAISLGRYTPADGPFDVAWAYGKRAKLQDPYNTNRLWGALHLTAPSLGLDISMPYEDRPVFVEPDDPLTRQDIAAILRYHYEGTELDQTDGYTLMSPHAQTSRPICYATTDYSVVFQMRDWLPDAVGGVAWLGLSRPCSSTYVPFYDSITSVPAAWGRKAAYVDFRAVADSLDADGTIAGMIRYKYYTPLVRGAYGAFAANMAAVQGCVESTAACLPPAQRRAYLTDYSSERAGEARDLAQDLIVLMP
jgi:dipeptidase